MMAGASVSREKIYIVDYDPHSTKIIVLFPLFSHFLCAWKIFFNQSTSRECINQALLRLYKNIFCCSLFDLLCNSLFTSLWALERNIPMQYNNHALYIYVIFISYLKSTRLCDKKEFSLGILYIQRVETLKGMQVIIKN